MDPHTYPQWPTVPACYEWLALDRRGQWRLRGERVTHAGLLAFLDRHYAVDTEGRWLVHNGPQKVYVDLAATPWIYRSAGSGFVTHSGRPAGAVEQLYLSAEGELLLLAATGIGLVDDRDLAALLTECDDGHGGAVDDATWSACLGATGTDTEPAIFWRGLRLQRLPAGCDLAARFGFVARPRP